MFNFNLAAMQQLVEMMGGLCGMMDGGTPQIPMQSADARPPEENFQFRCSSCDA
jgi:hypothetical protein